MRRPRNVAPPAGRRDEADVLAVGLGRRAQAELGGHGAAPRPWSRSPTGNSVRASVGLVEHVDDVALVLGPVGAAAEPRAAVGRRRSRAWWPVATASKPSSVGPLGSRRSNLRWRLHSMHGFGVRPAAWARDVRVDDVRVEVVAEVEHEVVDAELLGDPAGVVDVGHPAAPGVALAAPQLHRDADDVVALRRRSSAAATDESTPPLMATSTFTASPRPPRSRSRSVATAAATVDRVVDVGVGGGAAEREPQRRRRPAPVDAHRGEHVRRLHRAAGARRRRRRAHPGLVEQEQQRLALDALDAARGPTPATLCVARHGLDARRRRAAASPSTSRSRSAATRATVVGALGVGRRAAPSAMATMPATLWVPLRRSRSWPPPTISGVERRRRRARRARRRPSGRRTCGR